MELLSKFKVRLFSARQEAGMQEGGEGGREKGKEESSVENGASW